MNRDQRRRAERRRRRWLAALAKAPDISDDEFRVALALSKYTDEHGRITDPEINAAIREATA